MTNDLQNEIARAWSIARVTGDKQTLATIEKQYANLDPKNAYACFFTAWHIYFKATDKNFALSWEQYKQAAVAANAMTNDFAILDHSRMALAAGEVGMTCLNTNASMREQIVRLITAGFPVPFSLNGEHYEILNGYRTDDQGNLWFSILDPGWQNDAECSATDLLLYHKDAAGNKIYSKGHNGRPRAITRIYYLQKSGAVTA